MAKTRKINVDEFELLETRLTQYEKRLENMEKIVFGSKNDHLLSALLEKMSHPQQPREVQTQPQEIREDKNKKQQPWARFRTIV